MEISVKLQEFEGPLDLLLHLIEKNKVSIFDIPIVEITDQYMEYIHGIDPEEMGRMSEFLVMAATLLDIKAKMLLPQEVNEEGEETDPRQELVERLLEYKMYKYMSYELRDLQKDAEKVLFRKTDLPKEVQNYREPVRIEDLLDGVTLERLNAVFRDIMKRQELRTDPVRSRFGQVEKEEINLEETIEQVETYIQKHKKCSFRSLLQKKRGKIRVIITFLTILELMKNGKIEVTQEDTFAEIMITSKSGENPEDEKAADEQTAG
ncbi:MAG: segregation/condensation protein A [Eubacteriales bacterium]|nr:segregation/condensation protein A [Eubacteriales bacterium]